jgi:hypothetical protein
MAKKSSGPSKSQEIRDFYEANPTAKPKQVVEALAEKGVIVTPAFVSTIKSTSAKKGAKPKRAAKVAKSAGVSVRGSRPAAAKAAVKKSADVGLSLETLIKTKGLVKELGGIDNVISALHALKRLGE